MEINGWGTWIRTRDDDTKNRCLTAWPYPNVCSRKWKLTKIAFNGKSKKTKILSFSNTHDLTNWKILIFIDDMYRRTGILRGLSTVLIFPSAPYVRLPLTYLRSISSNIFLTLPPTCSVSYLCTAGPCFVLNQHVDIFTYPFITTFIYPLKMFIVMALAIYIGVQNDESKSFGVVVWSCRFGHR